MNLKIALCDDDHIFCNKLAEMVESIYGYSKCDIDIYSDGKSLADSEKRYDVIILDVEMPLLNGIETAKQLRKNGVNSYLIFLTSYCEYMQSAFKVNTFRYIFKPVKEDELKEALYSIEKQLSDNSFLMIKQKGDILRIALKDIICFEAYGDGSYIYTISSVIETRFPLKYWNETIDSSRYFQVHKSYIISFDYVKSLKQHEIEMSGMNMTVPVSFRKLKQFKKQLMNYFTENI